MTAVKFVPAWTVTCGGHNVTSCDGCPYSEVYRDGYGETEIECAHPKFNGLNDLTCNSSNDFDFDWTTMIHPDCPLEPPTDFSI